MNSWKWVPTRPASSLEVFGSYSNLSLLIHTKAGNTTVSVPANTPEGSDLYLISLSLFLSFTFYRTICFFVSRWLDSYAIRTELNNIHSIRRYTPTLAFGFPCMNLFRLFRSSSLHNCAVIVVMLENGVAYPPLYFLEGGVYEFIDALKAHLPLRKCAPFFNSNN